jgi:hypothetical protein
MEEAEEYDELMTDGWKDGAIGLIAFVSAVTLITMPSS